MKKVLDHTTQAGNQGSLRVTRADYVRYRGSTPLAWGLIYLNSLLPVMSWGKWRWGGFRWHHFFERFRYGDLNPALVLDAREGLVAVFTDLDSRMQKRYPVVKIFKEKLDRLPVPAKQGDTFAAISVYARGPQSDALGRWSTFHPVVIDCVLRDRDRCEFTKAMIADWEWQALEQGLSQISDKTQPGLYDVVLPGFNLGSQGG